MHDAERPEQLVARLLRAAAGRDIDAALECVAPDVVTHHDQTSATGRAELRAWLLASRATLVPTRWFAARDRVVVEHLVTRVPRDPEREAPQVATREATAFTLSDGLVSCIDHHASADAALRDARLGPDDRIEAPPA